jgi:hypothetical protein
MYLAVLGIIVLIGLTAQNSLATTDAQMWLITDTDHNADNAFVFSASWLLDSLNIPGYEIYSGGFYVYADGNGDGSLQLFGLSSSINVLSRSIVISDSNILTVAGVSGFLDLGASRYFGFYFTDDSGNRVGAYALNLADDGLSYELSSGRASVTISDAAPVPLPSTAILFGAGIMGLMGFGLRRQRSA